MDNKRHPGGFRVKGSTLNNLAIIGKRIIGVVESGGEDILWEYLMEFIAGRDRVAGTWLFQNGSNLWKNVEKKRVNEKPFDNIAIVSSDRQINDDLFESPVLCWSRPILR